MLCVTFCYNRSDELVNTIIIRQVPTLSFLLYTSVLYLTLLPDQKVPLPGLVKTYRLC